MSDGDGRPDPSARRDAELSGRLKDLGRRLDANRAASGPRGGEPSVDDGGQAQAGFALAMRMAADFVAGILVGAALGWGVDRLFGTSPWGLAAFLLLGFAAGIRNVIRTAGVVRTKSPGDRQSPVADDDDEDA